RRLGEPSRNRLEAYADERALWTVLAAARPGWAAVALGRAAEVDALVALERELILPLVAPAPAGSREGPGVVDVLDRAR
ncbi:MAG: hypothetical protein M9894_32600, partial [Planctomycetes bacterium]|nr:hypothetical protein [Planctomycetota bacterium]